MNRVRGWGRFNNKCGEKKSKGNRCASRDDMKPLDREPSHGAEPQRVLGDCATLGTITLRNFRPALLTPVDTRLRATLAAVTRFSEWPSHLTKPVGARKKGGAAH